MIGSVSSLLASVRTVAVTLGVTVAIQLGACRKASKQSGEAEESQQPGAPPPAVSALSAPSIRPLVQKASAEEVFGHLPPAEWSDTAFDQLDQAFEAEDKSDLHQKVLSLLLVAPVAERPSLAAHVANLTPDADYGPVSWLVVNGSLDPVSADSLMGDLHTRPVSLKLPVFAQILASPDHPSSKEAHRALITYLREDYGVPSALWGAAVQRYLDENPSGS